MVCTTWYDLINLIKIRQIPHAAWSVNSWQNMSIGGHFVQRSRTCLRYKQPGMVLFSLVKLCLNPDNIFYIFLGFFFLFTALADILCRRAWRKGDIHKWGWYWSLLWRFIEIPPAVWPLKVEQDVFILSSVRHFVQRSRTCPRYIQICTVLYWSLL
jgi:hypothetical protein